MLNFTGDTINPERATVVFGETTWAALPPIPDFVAVPNEPRPGDGDGYVQKWTGFAPRGCDLKDRDRFVYKGKTFHVMGDAQWDMNHPGTGMDFGKVVYTLELGGSVEE